MTLLERLEGAVFVPQFTIKSEAKRSNPNRSRLMLAEPLASPLDPYLDIPQ